MKNIRGRLVKASLWITGARGIESVLATLSTIVLARLLVPDDFGLVALATTMLAILSAFTELPVAAAIVQTKEPTEEHFHTAWTLNLIRASILGLGFAALSVPAAHFYAEPRLTNVMLALAVGVFITGLPNPRLITFQKNLIFRQVFILNTVDNLVLVTASITVAVIYQSYWALVAGVIAGRLARAVTSYGMFPYRPRLSLQRAREMLGFSVWLSLGKVVNTLSARFDHLLIGGILGRPALGHYTVGSNLAMTPTREATKPLAQTLFPAFALLTDDLPRLRRAYQRAQSTIMAVAVPAGVGVALVADPLVRLALGPNWIPVIAVLYFIAPAYAFKTFATASIPLAMAFGQTQYLFRRELQMLLIGVPLVLGGMFLWGFVGILYARVVSSLISTFINAAMVRSLVGISIPAQVRVNVRCLLSSAAMILAVVGVQSFFPQTENMMIMAGEIAASALTGGIVYLVTIALLWIASGRPQGPEAEALHWATALRERVRRRGSISASAEQR